VADPNIGQLYASTFEAIVGKGRPTNNVFNSRALLRVLADPDASGKARMTGYKEDVTGGRIFEYPIEYAENTNFQMIAEMDTLLTTRVDTFDAFQFGQRICAGTVVISTLETARNKGDQKFDVVAAKLENARDTATAVMNRNMWTGDGTGNNFDGLTRLISTTPATGTVGGVNRGTFAFARNRAVSGAKTATLYDNLRAAMTTTFNQCSLGGVDMVPTAAITDMTTFGAYESLLVAVEKIERSAKATGGDIGFLNDAIQFKGKCDLMYDEDAPANEVRFLNPKALKFTVLSGAWMKMMPPVDPANQLTEVTKVYTFGNLGFNGPRYLGVTYNVAG
jgi:hypothetical protein